LESHLKVLNEKYSTEVLDKKMIEFFERICQWKGAATLERKSDVVLDAKKLDKYFDGTAMIIDVLSDDSSSEEEDSQSEDEASSDERMRPTRGSSPSSSKRPRASSVSESHSAQRDSLSSPPPLKRERLGIIT
jgi:nucleosome binding factor SPN SPT16 subunit